MKAVSAQQGLKLSLRVQEFLAKADLLYFYDFDNHHPEPAGPILRHAKHPGTVKNCSLPRNIFHATLRRDVAAGIRASSAAGRIRPGSQTFLSCRPPNNSLMPSPVSAI